MPWWQQFIFCVFYCNTQKVWLLLWNSNYIQKSTTQQYPCIFVSNNLRNSIHFAPCNLHWRCIFQKMNRYGVCKLCILPNLSWRNNIILMVLLYCVFHHGNTVLFYYFLTKYVSFCLISISLRYKTQLFVSVLYDTVHMQLPFVQVA